MYEIRNLTGQEYVDAYATKKPDSMASATAVVSSEGPSAAGEGNGTGNGQGGSLAAEPARRSSADVLAGARSA
jgi:hypothetical protein